MATIKPIAYPNLTDAINSAVDAYTAVHDTVKTHAQEHGHTLAQRRTALSMQRAAKKLVDGSTPKSATETGA